MSARSEPIGRVQVRPPLVAAEVAFLAGFSREPLERHDAAPAAPTSDPVRRLWPGRPRGWSPWVPCADGCCLVIREGGSVREAAVWLRFLVHTFVRPSARRASLERLGLTFGHQVEGAVWFEGERQRLYLVSVRRNRVHADAVLLEEGQTSER